MRSTTAHHFSKNAPRKVSPKVTTTGLVNPPVSTNLLHAMRALGYTPVLLAECQVMRECELCPPGLNRFSTLFQGHAGERVWACPTCGHQTRARSTDLAHP